MHVMLGTGLGAELLPLAAHAVWSGQHLDQALTNQTPTPVHVHTRRASHSSICTNRVAS